MTGLIVFGYSMIAFLFHQANIDEDYCTNIGACFMNIFNRALTEQSGIAAIWK